jgi:hypothetical protein
MPEASIDKHGNPWTSKYKVWLHNCTPLATTIGGHACFPEFQWKVAPPAGNLMSPQQLHKFKLSGFVAPAADE